MPVLIKLGVDQDGNEIHVGGVKLEADGGRADVIARGHRPLHCQRAAHCVVDPTLEGDPMPLFDLGSPCAWRHCMSLSGYKVVEQHLSSKYYSSKDETKHCIPQVAVEVVEVEEGSDRNLTS